MALMGHHLQFVCNRAHFKLNLELFQYNVVFSETRKKNLFTIGLATPHKMWLQTPVV